jgi:hypothetical protein
MGASPSELYRRIERLHADQAAEAERIGEALTHAVNNAVPTYQQDQLLDSLEAAATKATRLSELMKLPADMIAHAEPALTQYEYGWSTPETPQARRLNAELNATLNPYDANYLPNRDVETQMDKARNTVGEWANAQKREDLGIAPPTPKANTDDGLSPFERAGAAWAEDAEGEV